MRERERAKLQSSVCSTVCDRNASNSNHRTVSNERPRLHTGISALSTALSIANRTAGELHFVEEKKLFSSSPACEGIPNGSRRKRKRR